MPIDLATAPAWTLALAGAGAGAIAGSFLSTVALRWPAGRAIAYGRSTCDSCGATLAPRDLVPILSWAWSRGRCRRCTARIDPRHPLAEAIAALIGAMALWTAPGWWGIAGAGFGWTLLLLALLDFDHYWLPDRLTLPLGVAGIGVALVGGPVEPRLSMIGAAAGGLGLAAVGLLYRIVRGRRGLGGGDPKLFVAIGAWVGWVPLPLVLLGASLAGIATALALHVGGRPIAAGTRLPFGLLLAPAGFMAWILDARGG